MLGRKAALIFCPLLISYKHILHKFFCWCFFSTNLTAEVVPYNKIIKVVIVNGIYLLFQIKFSHSSLISNILLKNMFTVQSLPLKAKKLHTFLSSGRKWWFSNKKRDSLSSLQSPLSSLLVSEVRGGEREKLELLKTFISNQV